MPIRPENKDRYPKDWPAISHAIRERAKFRCEECGVRNGELGGRLPNGAFLKAWSTGERLLRRTWPEPGDWSACGKEGRRLRIVRIVLTVAHLDHTPENCAPENLRALCQRCHNKYDAPMRAAGIRERSKAMKAAGDLFEGES